MSLELLKRLCETPGLSGREERIRAVIKEEMEKLVDEVRVDAIGNVIGIKKGSGKKRVMIAGHMDEIGFRITHIDERGFLRITSGGDARTLVAQRVIVHGRQDLRGVLMPGIKPPHLLTPEEANKKLDSSQFFVDLGMSKEELSKLVRVGDPITMDRDFLDFGSNVSCKALDDRVGVYVMLEALREVKQHDVDIYAVATVQEEVGLRGATTSANSIEPHIGVALDVTIAADIPGTSKEDYITALGSGTAIKIKDSASISNYKLVDFMESIAIDNDIKYQMELLPRGGTDAGAMERSQSGCPVITLSVPTRYVHTVVETAHKEDIKATINLLARFLEVAHTGDFTL